MRALIAWLLLVTILGIAAFLAAPAVAQPLLAAAVRAALPSGSKPLEVDVSASTLGLLGGSIDQVHIAGEQVTSGTLTIGSLDATLHDVSIGDHSFASIDGKLVAVTMDREGQPPISIDSVDLSGASSEAAADALFSRAAAIDLVRNALAAANLEPSKVELINGGFRVTALGQRADLTVGVVDGAVTVAGPATFGTVTVYTPPSGAPWRITGVSTSPTGIDVHGLVDVDQALRGR